MAPSPKQLKKHLEFREHLLAVLSELYLAVESMGRLGKEVDFSLDSLLRYLTRSAERRSAAAVGMSRAARRRGIHPQGPTGPETPAPTPDGSTG